jgi:hypothetical protein
MTHGNADRLKKGGSEIPDFRNNLIFNANPGMERENQTGESNH